VCLLHGCVGEANSWEYTGEKLIKLSEEIERKLVWMKPDVETTQAHL